MCIIAIPEFKTDWQNPLPGYNHDRQKLSELWDALGFDVFIPESDPARGLTAHVSY